nr:hypothetical protein [Tanacetum cinerariifolium]
MNYLEEQTDEEAMINSIKNSDQPLPRVTQVSIAGTSSTEQPPLKDKSMCNKTAKDLWDAFARHMLGSEYGEQDRKAAPGWKQYATMMRQNKNLMDINIDALYNILKQNQGDVNDAMGSKKKTVVVTYDPLALIAKKTNEGPFTKDCKKVKVKDYEYYKTKMLLAKKDKDEQVLLAEDQAWMESCREYSQWVERFMNYLEEQTDGDAMINSIKNGDQPLPRVTQVSIAGTTSTEQPPSKDKSMCNMTAKDLWDALARHMLGSEYGDVKDAMGSKKKTVMVTSDPLALIAEKINVSRSKEKVVVSSDSEGSGSYDFSELKKITALLAKAFNRRKFYSKPTNNNLRTSSSSQSANKKQEFVKTNNKQVEKKADEKKRDMSRVKCYNCKKEGHFAKDCKKGKVKDYEYYKTKMLLTKKDKDEQVLLVEDQAWMESSYDSDQEINANMVFMAQI